MSKRSLSSESNALMEGFRRVMGNPYSDTNPEGIINLGVAENRILLKDMADKLNSLIKVQEDMLIYQDFTGTQRLKQVLALFLNRKLNPVIPIKPEELVCVNGVGSCGYLLAMGFCNENDGILIPSPFYGGFYFDMKPAEVYPIPAPMDPKTNFEIDLEILEESFNNSSKPIKALLITNPDNPLGKIYSRKEIELLLKFAHDKDIHIIFDEIYALSIWNDSNEEFKSILTFENLPNPSKTHFMWGFSKDFLGNGIRFACIHSRNQDFLNYTKSVGIITGISSIVDKLMADLLKDEKWIDEFIKKNQKVLYERFNNTVLPFLQELQLDYFKPKGGFFIFVNFRNYLLLDENIENLSEREKLGEIKLWNLWLDNGIYIAPGKAAFNCKEAGWFRIVFSEKTDELLIMAFERIKNVLLKIKKP